MNLFNLIVYAMNGAVCGLLWGRLDIMKLKVLKLEQSPACSNEEEIKLLQTQVNELRWMVNSLNNVGTDHDKKIEGIVKMLKYKHTGMTE